MRLSTITALLAAASIALSAFGAWSFYRSFDAIPTNLYTFTGTATAVRTSTTLSSRSHATFLLKQSNGESIEVSYRPMYKRFHYFAEHLKDGMPVEVTTGPGGVHDIWGIKLDSQPVMTVEEARDARLTDGRWGFALFLGFLIAALWCSRQARDFRSRGI